MGHHGAMKRLLLLVAALLLLAPATARAESAAQVAAALRSTPVYQSAGLNLVDVATLTSELSGSDPVLKVAVLSASAASSAAQADARATEIGRALGDSNAVVLVITANQHLGAGEGKAAAARGISADAALADELATSRGAFTKDNLTAFVTSFKERLATQLSSGDGSGSTGSGTSSSSGTSSNAGKYLLGGLVVLGGGGAALAVVSSRRRRGRRNEEMRADVEALYNRLGSDVSTLDPKDDAVARQAMVDAAERYNACGSALSNADTPGEFAAARRTAVEGLTAARTARVKLGLDPGPEIPLPPGSGPQLTADQQVVLAGQAYDGSPTYQPGRQHYYGGGALGGQMVPGGWYSTPFWEPFVLGSLLSGGFGGFGGGGGGFERGYEAGQDDARDRHDSGGGGDWGGGGGGGGGDWGGGGDSGGGGGDSGGDSGGGGGDW